MVEYNIGIDRVQDFTGISVCKVGCINQPKIKVLNILQCRFLDLIYRLYITIVCTMFTHSILLEQGPQLIRVLVLINTELTIPMFRCFLTPAV